MEVELFVQENLHYQELCIKYYIISTAHNKRFSTPLSVKVSSSSYLVYSAI